MLRFLPIILFYASIFWGCSEKELDPNDPVKSFAIVKEPYDDENFEHAITRLGEFKSRFPYSRYATEAELLIANSHFELDQFPEAAVSYEQFVKLHPKHPKVDFAMYRIGESYWEDAPEAIDRDQEYTLKALDSWKEMVAKHPKSSYAQKAKKLMGEGHRRMAESVSFIVKFYCKQDIYHACAYRALQLAEDYKDFPDLRVLALEKAVISLKEVAKQKKLEPSSDKNLFLKNMSESELKSRAENLQKLLLELDRKTQKPT